MQYMISLIVAFYIGGMAMAWAAEDHNSSRSNRGQVTAAPTGHNTTRSNRSAPANMDSANMDSDSMDNSDSDSLYGQDTPRDAASGLPTGKRQHKPVN